MSNNLIQNLSNCCITHPFGARILKTAKSEMTHLSQTTIHIMVTAHSVSSVAVHSVVIHCKHVIALFQNSCCVMEVNICSTAY